MKALLLVALLVCVLWTHTAHSQTALRLCGREFVRAVVYSCGGSRWRRIISEIDKEGYVEQDALQPATESERLRRTLDRVLPVVCCTIGCLTHDLNRLC